MMQVASGQYTAAPTDADSSQKKVPRPRSYDCVTICCCGKASYL